MNPIARGYWTAQGVGWDNVPRRVLQAWRVRSGRLRRRLDPVRFSDTAYRTACRVAVKDQPERWRDRAGRFFPMPSADALGSVADEAAWEASVGVPCREALAGRYPFFSGWTGELGWPPNFNHDPLHAIDWPVGGHWLGTARSGPPRHDIKLVWEPNRFTLAYHLARAYRRGGDERWALAFWLMFEAWVAQNPPQLSVAWGCGQETAFRLMAMLTAAVATLDSEHATPQRLDALTRFAWQAATRIEININYAISQKNNHGLSEALGLWTVGLLFDEFPESGCWRDKGAKTLAHECRRQIYDDGSFVQHSLNYHRVMLDDLMWCLRLGELSGRPLPEVVLDRFRRATGWLAQLVDPVSGRVPNYGSNDGANVLPLACADYLDYRPTLQAAHRVAYGKPCFDPGPWDEKALWLGGATAASGSVTPVKRESSWSATDGGYYVLRGDRGWLMTRCCTYRDRPSQADQLHVDLWHRGVNVLRDGGSYLYYNDNPHWAHYFHATAAHNTIQIDDREQMTKGPRFLWFHWPRGRGQVKASVGSGIDGRFSGEAVMAASPGAKIMRTIDRRDDVYLIRDQALGGVPTVRWRLAPLNWKRQGDLWQWRAWVGGEAWLIHLCADPEATCAMTEGWESLYYGQKTACPVLVWAGQDSRGGGGGVVTLMGPVDRIEAWLGRDWLGDGGAVVAQRLAEVGLD